MRIFGYLFFLCICSCSLFCSEEVKVDLHSPVYEDGVLTTDQGGVIEGPEIRIQARKITYTKKKDRWFVEASGDLLVHYKGRHFVGDSLEYDFEKQKGVIDKGRTQIGSWFLGGETIRLKSKGTYEVKEMSMTTCEKENSLWQLRLGRASIQDDNLLTAHNMQVRLFKLPIFWFPYFRAKLSLIQNAVAKYEFITGGTVGERASMRYQIYSWRHTNVFLQGDYWFTRGPSASLQFDYKAPRNFNTFQANNFIAFDYHGAHPYGIFRNRFVGELKSKFFDRLEITGEYDKLSDDNVLQTYFNRDYFLQIERRTKLQVRYTEDNWLGFLRTEVRINPFDVVSQELPLFYFNLRPLTLSSTPIITDFSFNAGYLDFVYGNVFINSPNNFRSPRVELYPKVYMPVHLGPLCVTPSAEYIGIGYGQSPLGHAVWNSLGQLGAEATVKASRRFGRSLKHVVEPYTAYTYYTRPTLSFNDHYFFNIHDSYVKLNQLKWGLRNFLYYKPCEKMYLPLFLDVYMYGFFNNTTIGSFLPKMYIELSSRWPSLYVQLWGGYNFQHRLLDSANASVAYTFNERLALSIGFRHRSRYDYRKANHDNFFLDVFRSQADLLASPLSDRRDVLLTSLYVRPHKRVILGFKSRTGWDRVSLPYYNEVFFTLTVLLPCNWKFHFTPRNTVAEGWRWDFRFELGEAPPSEAAEPFIFW